MPKKNEFLKFTAIITMLIDHIGYAFFSNILLFRIIGRISYPIFAFLLVRGYEFTSNVNKYLFRLFVFSFISFIPYKLLFGRNLNIFFTLIWGLMLIYFLDSKNKADYGKYEKFLSGQAIKDILEVLIIFIFCFIAQISKLPYGAYGVGIIVIFYNFKDKKISTAIRLFLINLIYLYIIKGNYIQIFSMLSLIFIYVLEERITIYINLNKYFYYWFYPVHILVIYLIKLFK